MAENRTATAIVLFVIIGGVGLLGSRHSNDPPPGGANPYDVQATQAAEASVAKAVAVAQGKALGNEAHDILNGMSDAKRNQTLAMFMQQSGEACSNVTRNFYQGSDRSGNAFWNITCSNGKSWSVMIFNDSTGSTKILECSVMEAAGGVCFKKLKF